MISAIELDPTAMSALFSLDQREAEFVSFNLFKLAESPWELSVSSSFPVGMEYSFQLVAGLASATWFTVVWQYKREEIIYVKFVQRSTSPPA